MKDFDFWRFLLKKLENSIVYFDNIMLYYFGKGGTDLKFKRTITAFVFIIAALSIISCLAGIISGGGSGEYTFRSIHGETIKIFGKGLYQYESAAQRLALNVQDIFTLVLAIPLLIISLFFSLKGSLKGRFLLTGTTAYFLYTYITYSFLREFNSLFLIYTALMSVSLFAFILCMMSFDINKLSFHIKPGIPVKFIGGFQILLALGLIFTWVPPILTFLINGTIPVDLEHYNSLGYEAIDLGIMIPALILSAVLIIKRINFGYLLSGVLLMQSISMITLISVLTIVQVMSGMNMPFIIMIMFPVFNVILIFCLVLLLGNVKEKTQAYASM